MHIYVFGSICRGELGSDSDIDLLFCSTEYEKNNLNLDNKEISIYSYEKLDNLWKEGNPFAWHLYLESVLVYSSDGKDYLRGLGKPNQYMGIISDFYKFKDLYYTSYKNLCSEINRVFNLSCMFLALRNVATCYSLFKKTPTFSRLSMMKIEKKLNVPHDIINILERARILSTRGIGNVIDISEIELIINYSDVFDKWFDELEEEIYER